MSQIEYAPSSAAQLEYTSSARRRVVTFAFLATLFDGADFFIFIYFLHPLASYFGISLVKVTVIQAISYSTGVIGGLMFGMIADKWGRRMGLGLSVAAYSIFTFISAFSMTFNTLLILRALAGVGIGGESGIAYAYLNEAYHAGKSHRGLFCGALSTMFVFGGLVATAIFHVASLLHGHEAWRWGFGYLGLVVILAVAILKFMPESRMWLASRNQKRTTVPLMDIFRKGLARTTIVGTILLTFGFFGFYALMTFAPSLWIATYHLSASGEAKVGYIGMSIAIISQLSGGWLADIIGRKNSFTLSGLIGAAGYLFFLIVGPILKLPVRENMLWAALPFFAVMVVQLGFGYLGAQGAWFAELYPTHARATGQNFVYYVSRAIGAGFGPLIAISIATKMGYDVRMAISLGIVGMVMTAVISRFLPETKGTELRNE